MTYVVAYIHDTIETGHIMIFFVSLHIRPPLSITSVALDMLAFRAVCALLSLMRATFEVGGCCGLDEVGEVSEDEEQPLVCRCGAYADVWMTGRQVQSHLVCAFLDTIHMYQRTQRTGYIHKQLTCLLAWRDRGHHCGWVRAASEVEHLVHGGRQRCIVIHRYVWRRRGRRRQWGPIAAPARPNCKWMIFPITLRPNIFCTVRLWETICFNVVARCVTVDLFLSEKKDTLAIPSNASKKAASCLWERQRRRGESNWCLDR